MEQKLLYLFFIYLVAEGALRKWFLPEYSNELFLVKDLLLMFAALVYLGKRALFKGSDESVFTRHETALMWMWACLSFGHFFINGLSITSFVGLRYYLVMLPLMFILPRALLSLDVVERLSMIYLSIACIVCVLGLVQYFSPQNALINRYAWKDPSMAIAMFGQGKARITGTFSYISPYAVYLQFMVLVGLALFSISEAGRSHIYIGVVTSLIFVNIIMTGSRAPFLISSLLAIPFLFDMAKKTVLQRGRFFTVIAGILIGVIILLWFGDVFSTLSERNKEAGDSDTRVIGALLMPLYTFQEIDIMGAGIGSTFLGMSEMSSGNEKTQFFNEVTSDRIGVETGIFGYMFFLFFKLLFMIKAWVLYRSASNQHIKAWALVSFCFQLSLLWSIPVYNSVAAAFYFTSIGLYVLLRNEQIRIESELQPVSV